MEPQDTQANSAATAPATPAQPAKDLALAPLKLESIAKAPANLGMVPRSFEEGWRFSQMIARSGLAPKDYKDKPENVMVAIQMGAEVGLSPMAALQNIAVINGRPSLWGDAALAVVQAHHAYEWHKEFTEGDGEAKVAVFQIKRRGHEVHVARFSRTDAKVAGLLTKEGPWKTYPDRMLQMRARGFGLRDKFADALRGLITAEEAMDIPAQLIDLPPEEAAAAVRSSVTSATDQATSDLSKKYAAPSPENPSQAPAAATPQAPAPAAKGTEPMAQVGSMLQPAKNAEEALQAVDHLVRKAEASDRSRHSTRPAAQAGAEQQGVPLDFDAQQ